MIICLLFSFLSGKTHFTIRLIKLSSDIFEKPPHKIIYAYGVYQDAFDNLEATVSNLIFHEGLPSETYLMEELDTTKHNLLILDDLIEEIGKSKEVCNMITRSVHHKKISIAILYQNLFFPSPYIRTISLNLTYFVLMKTFRDRQQILTLARQMFGKGSGRMIEAYEDCIKQERGYLIVNNATTGDDQDRLVTNIFPGDVFTMYLPK